MSLYDLWPFLLIVTGVLLILRIDPIFAVIDGATSGAHDRFSAIDGLRGFLAFGVFGHHAVVTHEFLLTGVWEEPRSAFYSLLGQAGVSMFFAITGFLFWGKLLKAYGAVDWRKLYIGRFFRIAPVYLATVTVMLLVVGVRTNFALQESPFAVWREVTRWLGLGILGLPDVNGYDHTALLMAGVTWTLRYEWLYYFSLPLLAVFATRARHLLFTFTCLVLCLAIYAIKPIPHVLYASLFFCGMTAASLLHEGLRMSADSKWGFAIAAVCLWLLTANFSTVRGVAQVLLLGIAFYVISSGNTLLGIMTAKGSRRLGEISYSVYLIHGLLLTGIFSIESVRSFALRGFGQYWLIIALCGLVLVLVASLSYVFIERPGINLGKKWAAEKKPRVAS
jgi:peptidoglycan/LPS O-acetylase OafA/YrhL